VPRIGLEPIRSQGSRDFKSLKFDFLPIPKTSFYP
jgi:hypothetical protein